MVCAAWLLGLLYILYLFDGVANFSSSPPNDYGDQIERVAWFELGVARQMDDQPRPLRWLVAGTSLSKTLDRKVYEITQRNEHHSLDGKGANILESLKYLQSYYRGELSKDSLRLIINRTAEGDEWEEYFESYAGLTWEIMALEVIYSEENRPEWVSEVIADADGQEQRFVLYQILWTIGSIVLSCVGIWALLKLIRGSQEPMQALRFPVSTWTTALVLVAYALSEFILAVYLEIDYLIPISDAVVFEWFRYHVWQIIPVCFILVVLFRKFGHVIRTFGLNERPHWRWVWMGAGVTTALMWIIEWIVPESYNYAPLPSYSSDMDTLSGALSNLMSAVILAPLTEEIIYRGVLFGGMLKRFGYWPAAILSSVLFSAIHYYDLIGSLDTFVFGMVMCAIFYKMRSLTEVILIHAITNFFIVSFQWYFFYSAYFS